jgi:hypothetical protein
VRDGTKTQGNPLTVATDFQAITPTLFAWQAYEPTVKCDLSSCALDGEDGLFFVDPIELSDPALDRLLLGRKPRAIILTNGNHTRAARELRTRLRVKVFAPADADGLDFSPDETLADGQTAPGGMQAVTLPGAGPGEIALVGHGIACIGDALINLPPDGFRLLPGKYCNDAGLMRDSLRKLLSYEFQVMTFAHGAPLVESARWKLEQLLT